MEHDNVKWKYNLEKHSVYEFDLPNATHLIIPVSGTVDWADGEDVTGKFRIELTFDKNYSSIAIPLRKAYNSVKEMFNDIANGRGDELENQSQEQDNVTGVEKTAYDFLTERFGHFNIFHPVSVLGYAKGIEPDIEDILECMEDYLDLRLDPILQHEAALEAANAFHKKFAEDVQQEQYRLQKENEVLKEKVNELTMADMTHEYNQAEADRFRSHFEEQICIEFLLDATGDMFNHNARELYKKFRSKF